MLEQTWDFPPQGFHSYCTCQRIILPLSPTPIQELRKSLIFYTICCNTTPQRLQIIPPSAVEATAPSAAIWASSKALSNTSPDKAGKIQHNISETYPITSVTGLSRGAKGGLGNVDESTERARKPSPLSDGSSTSYRTQSTCANLGIIQIHNYDSLSDMKPLKPHPRC